MRRAIFRSGHKLGSEIPTMQLQPLTRHVTKEERDAFVVYAEDNYSTIFDPMPSDQPEAEVPEKTPDPGELE
jgi:hypothetical protein